MPSIGMAKQTIQEFLEYVGNEACHHWIREHNYSKYILNPRKSIITVSRETMKIVNALPALKERKEIDL